MKDNRFAQQTISYIWTHPNCRSKQLQSIAKFIGWQFYKRLTRNYLDFKLTPNVKLRCYPDSNTKSDLEKLITDPLVVLSWLTL